MQAASCAMDFRCLFGFRSGLCEPGQQNTQHAIPTTQPFRVSHFAFPSIRLRVPRASQATHRRHPRPAACGSGGAAHGDRGARSRAVGERSAARPAHRGARPAQQREDDARAQHRRAGGRGEAVGRLHRCGPHARAGRLGAHRRARGSVDDPSDGSGARCVVRRCPPAQRSVRPRRARWRAGPAASDRGAADAPRAGERCRLPHPRR